jgi:hypothetical protein
MQDLSRFRKIHLQTESRRTPAREQKRFSPGVLRGSAPGMRSLLGVNLPYLYGSYGHDLAPSAQHPDWPCNFDAMRAYSPLIETRDLGLEAARIWLCERAEGLIIDSDGKLMGVHPKLLESIRILEEAAVLLGLRIYWTLLDANAVARDGDSITRSILEQPDQAQRFAERIVAPIVRTLDPRVSLALEIVNEPEVMTDSCADTREDKSQTSIPWNIIGSVISQARKAARAEQNDLWITSGTGHVFLPELWRHCSDLDAIDIHVYHPDGGLPSRQDLSRYVGDSRIVDSEIPLIAGECGIPKVPGSEELPPLPNYLYNADTRGYSAAFLWKLDGDLVDSKAPKRVFTPLGNLVRHVISTRPSTGFAL